MKPQSAASVFQVASVDAALRYYKEVLGFSEDFRFGEYAGVKLGDAYVHLCGHSIHNRPIGGGTVHVFCDEVDSYYAEIKRNPQTCCEQVKFSESVFGLLSLVFGLWSLV